MTDHALTSRAEVADQAVSIRAELKVWEKEFASTHSGQKAGRDDIKQNPEIGKSGLKTWIFTSNWDRELILCYSCEIQRVYSTQKPRGLPSPTRESPAGTLRKPLQEAKACVAYWSRIARGRNTAQVNQRAICNSFQQPHQRDPSSAIRPLRLAFDLSEAVQPQHTPTGLTGTLSSESSHWPHASA